ncbi:TPA: NAD-dependent epimerase/dehydratase family protein [Candidatus Bipolaricaulota bacterium]|nr:NAD-dependent epimerase/dehydratase family protein [Candidatus Bipolaricaulota bacterium]
MVETIFLTGGTGLLGRKLLPALIEKGYRLKVLVRPSSDLAGLEGSGWGLELELVLGDVRWAESFSQALEGIKMVIHLAGIVSGRREELLETNWRGTAHLVRAALAAGVERIIHLSSLGAGPEPRFPYAYSVWLAEEEVRRSGLHYIIFRPSILVGGDPFTGALIRMARNWPVLVLPESRVRFQPLWVEDMVRCILLALGSGSGPGSETKNERLWGRTIPLGGPEALTLDEIAWIILTELGLKRPILHLPRRPLRALVRALRRLGLESPYVEGHFIGRDNLAGPGAVEAAFGFVPRPLREVFRLELQRKAEF